MSAPKSNLLLQSLSAASRESILSVAEEVILPIRSSLEPREQPPRFLHFLTSGIASVVVEVLEGGAGETSLVGREGMVGAYSLLGSSFAPSHTYIQVAATGYRVPYAAIHELFQTSQEVRSRILECVQQQAMTTTQIAACNIAHEAEPRLARWLLMVQDRTQEDTFRLTQEFLAVMLGTRRSTVALAAGALQRRGLIEYSRGIVNILSRGDLEAAACDCYAVTRRLLLALFR